MKWLYYRNHRMAVKWLYFQSTIECLSPETIERLGHIDHVSYRKRSTIRALGRNNRIAPRRLPAWKLILIDWGIPMSAGYVFGSKMWDYFHESIPMWQLISLIYIISIFLGFSLAPLTLWLKGRI